MNTDVAAGETLSKRKRRSRRSLAVLGLGPLTALAGLVWAGLQPYRITLVNPRGEGFWWLFAEAPLLVVLVGVVFALFIAPGIVQDLEREID